MKTKLFLHMGPGYHSDVERKLLGNLYPDVEFWNQPVVSSYGELVGVTINKIHQLYDEAQKPIMVIGHSFGGTLAAAAVNEIPEAISEVRMLNSAIDPFECFINMSGHLFSEGSIDYPRLRKATVPEKIQFLIQVASAPGFSALYWQSKQRWQELEPILSQVPALNTEIFISVFSDFLYQNQVKTEIKNRSDKSVKIFYSTSDVLINRGKDLEPWKERYKEAQITELRHGGHHPHLEDVEESSKIFKS